MARSPDMRGNQVNNKKKKKKAISNVQPSNLHFSPDCSASCVAVTLSAVLYCDHYSHFFCDSFSNLRSPCARLSALTTSTISVCLS